MLSCLTAQEYVTYAGNVKKIMKFEASENTTLKKKTFQPRWDKIGGKVRVFSNEKFVDSFMSSNMWKNCNWSSRNGLNMEQSPGTEVQAEWILRKC